jgi:murein L,D-transpeptidase YcbB/YkuD
MRVIVGKPDMQTPVMAGLMRYVTLNPYWNVPPDLARERARKVLSGGTGLITRERLQILSDWSDSPRLLNASQVDWGAVASGRRSLRLRQLPGGANVMGNIKFMMPNDLGIYLHDFPDKSLFERADRRLSSGCVRLHDAPRLARWLYRGEPPKPAGDAPEQDVDLPEAVPVYIAYLTVLPDGRGGLAFRPDTYGRDRRA